jgi:hypothetical protein
MMAMTIMTTLIEHFLYTTKKKMLKSAHVISLRLYKRLWVTLSFLFSRWEK